MEWFIMFWAISLGVFFALRCISIIIDLINAFKNRGARYRILRRYCVMYTAESYGGDILPFKDATVYSYHSLKKPGLIKVVEKDLKKHGYAKVTIEDIVEY